MYPRRFRLDQWFPHPINGEGDGRNFAVTSFPLKELGEHNSEFHRRIKKDYAISANNLQVRIGH